VQCLRWLCLRLRRPPAPPQVQLEEKEKLQLTAALHLERLRLCEAGGGQGQDQGLLREGVKRLEGRVAAVNGRINELLEEVMYEMEGL
jgi:hypothetical protein